MSEDSSALVVRPNVYVIPNALVAEQFTPATKPVSSETSKCFHVVVVERDNSFFSSLYRGFVSSGVS